MVTVAYPTHFYSVCVVPKGTQTFSPVRQWLSLTRKGRGGGKQTHIFLIFYITGNVRWNPLPLLSQQDFEIPVQSLDESYKWIKDNWILHEIKIQFLLVPNFTMYELALYSHFGSSGLEHKKRTHLLTPSLACL